MLFVLADCSLFDGFGVLGSFPSFLGSLDPCPSVGFLGPFLGYFISSHGLASSSSGQVVLTVSICFACFVFPLHVGFAFPYLSALRCVSHCSAVVLCFCDLIHHDVVVR